MSEEKLQRQCGEWRLEREIGQGAYGVVYLAIRSSGERVAVKVCRREDVGDERFTRELRGAKLYRAIPPQEGLVRMRDLVETEWGFFTVMDLADDEFASDSVASSGRAASPFAAASGVCRPKTLARVIEGEKALPLKECVQLALSLAKGLATLQRHHLLHRDIKPGNVLYVKGQPVLSDPGLIVEESEAASLVGTPGYIPPEKFTDAASDIYSLGLTLKAASFGRQVEDLDKGPAMEADTGASHFSAWWRILNKTTDPTPSRRYQSAKALLKDLESLRRKVVLTPIIGSRIAKVFITVLALAAIAIIVSIVVTSRRAQHDLVRQAAETKLLKDDLVKQSDENKSLKDDLARQSEEIKSLKSDLVRQPNENKSLKDTLARQSEENKSLKDDLARQSEEIKSLKSDLVRQPNESKSLKEALDRQSEESKSLKEALDRQSEESKSLKEALDRQSEESKSLKDAFDRQSDENKSLKTALARQFEENKMLKNDLSRQSAEIKSLKDDIIRQPKGGKAKDVDADQQSVELEQLRKEVEQLRKVSDEKARVAAQDAWEAVLRNAYRETFHGISEEELTSMVKNARNEIFGDKK